MTGPVAIEGDRPTTGRRSVLGTVVPIVVGALIALAVWQLIVVVGGYPPFILPDPPTVVGRFVSAWTDGTIGPHRRDRPGDPARVPRRGRGGLLVGYLLARSRLANLVLSPYLVAAQATPILALAPLLVLWFGTGLLSKVVICALIVFFPVAISTIVGLRSVDRAPPRAGPEPPRHPRARCC